MAGVATLVFFFLVYPAHGCARVDSSPLLVNYVRNDCHLFMSKPRIAFIGLGIMGSNMSARLVQHGFPVTVYNRNAEKTKPLVGLGATAAATPRDAAAGAKIVISMVADDAASQSLWQGENGALGSVTPGTICIESSTVTVEWVKELAAAVAARHGEFLDAPVAGSKLQSAAGELNFIVGGSECTLETAMPVLMTMGKNIHHAGPTGSGAMLKLINNFLSGVQIAAAAEAMAVIERCGLDRNSAVAFLANSSPGSPMFKIVTTRMLAGDYSPHFMLRWMAKDLGYAIKEAKKLSLELETAQAALKECQKGVEAGHGDEDISAILETVRKR